MTQSTYQVSDGLTWREVNGDLVVMELDSGHYHLFNPVGGKIWMGLASNRLPSDIAGELVQRYDVDWERAQMDVTAFVATLMRKQLLSSDASTPERRQNE
jgi:hypothetical protein